MKDEQNRFNWLRQRGEKPFEIICFFAIIAAHFNFSDDATPLSACKLKVADNNKKCRWIVIEMDSYFCYVQILSLHIITSFLIITKATDSSTLSRVDNSTTLSFIAKASSLHDSSTLQICCRIRVRWAESTNFDILRWESSFDVKRSQFRIQRRFKIVFHWTPMHRLCIQLSILIVKHRHESINITLS